MGSTNAASAICGPPKALSHLTWSYVRFLLTLIPSLENMLFELLGVNYLLNKDSYGGKSLAGAPPAGRHLRKCHSGQKSRH